MQKQFIVVYPDGSKKNINAREREEALLALEIVSIGDGRYRYLGETKTFHSFSDWAKSRSTLQLSSTPLRRFLGLNLIFEFKGKKYFENEERPEALAARCVEMGAI